MNYIIIAGSRHFNNYNYLKEKCDHCLKNLPPAEITIISGTAKGADTLGELYAKNNNIPVLRFPARWDIYDKSAGPIRNRAMAHIATHLIAFKYPNSRGTQAMVDIATQHGLKIRVFDCD